MNIIHKNKWAAVWLGFSAVIFSQLIYFIVIIGKTTTLPTQDFDLVLTYSDAETMVPALKLAQSRHKPLYVSIAPWEPTPFRNMPLSGLKEVHIDPRGKTTDQNARRAAEFIRQGGYKRVVLDVAWFHVPRSLFLTKLYLLGSGVEVTPCDRFPAPLHWWMARLLRIEFFKFWGSLGRVLLALDGWETGPDGPR